MLETIVGVVLFLVLTYAVAGVGVTIGLHLRGLRLIDPAVRGGGWFFRALITPGLVALWPVMLSRWRRAAAGAPLEPRPDRPLTAEGLRRMHALLAPVLAVLLPILLGIALRGRAEVPTATPPDLPQPPPLANVLRTYAEPFSALPVSAVRVRRGDGRRLQLEIESAADLEQPPLFAMWSFGQGPTGNSVLLGRVWGPGVQRFALPADVELPFGTLWIHDMVNERPLAWMPLGD